MSQRIKNLANLFSNLRMRTIILATVGILFLVMLVGLLGFHHANKQQIENAASVKNIPDISSVPGLTTTSPEYAKVQASLNEKQYLTAEAKSGTAIPTIIADQTAKPTGDGPSFRALVGEEANKLPQRRPIQGQPAVAQKSQISPETQQLIDQQKAHIVQLQQAVDTANQAATQQATESLAAPVRQQAEQLIASWSSGGDKEGVQEYVTAEALHHPLSGGAGGSAAGLTQTADTTDSTADKTQQQSAATNNLPSITAGSVLLAVLDTAINSDEPGPVLATVVDGPYKGAKLVGSLQNTRSLPGTNGPTRVEVIFSTLALPYSKDSVTVNAVAIDLDTARTALASDVDHHYLERYGSLFASAFLEGYGSAVQQQGSTVTNSIFGGSSQSYGDLSGVEEVAVGLGQVGQSWGSQLGEVLSRQNTVTVDPGTGVGVLFLGDLDFTQSSLPTTGKPSAFAASGNTNE